ncbi:unnamed protein product [Vicia faba]|uniref:Reverse transcriptase zinc-binding domain-containing protein n=1 Tax=Vicia faba TaxID=3906 RepID=A0AAV0YZS6_VICFA|nr:unnamed protein product [Vicia faba]
MNNSDQRIWHNSNPDTLSLKESYFFKNRITDRLSWANHILSVDTPPSKLLVVWRLMHDKLPTDDQLQSMGCILALVCSLCHNHEETTQHLSFHYYFGVKIWNWLGRMLNFMLQFRSMNDI